MTPDFDSMLDKQLIKATENAAARRSESFYLSLSCFVSLSPSILFPLTHSICLSLCRNVCLCCSTSSLVLKYVHLKVSNNKQQTTFCILYLFNLNPI